MEDELLKNGFERHESSLSYSLKCFCKEGFPFVFTELIKDMSYEIDVIDRDGDTIEVGVIDSVSDLETIIKLFSKQPKTTSKQNESKKYYYIHNDVGFKEECKGCQYLNVCLRSDYTNYRLHMPCRLAKK